MKKQLLETIVKEFYKNNINSDFKKLNSYIHTIDEKDGIYCCLWKVMSFDKNSTTFESVDRNHPTLAKCKYDCLGYDMECVGYRVLK